MITTAKKNEVREELLKKGVSEEVVDVVLAYVVEEVENAGDEGYVNGLQSANYD